MISKWLITEHIGKRKGCVIGLTGRGMLAEQMEKFINYMRVPNSLAISLEPVDMEWYPQPNGVYDQESAVKGLPRAIDELSKRINKIQRAFRLRRNQIALVGYSAGAVMALQIVSKSNQPFAAVVSMSGAVLEPHNLPQAPNDTPILLRHAVDDTCFSWEERYLPMKKGLMEKGYNLFVSEKNSGGHGIQIHDARMSGSFVSSYLGYKNTVEEDDD